MGEKKQMASFSHWRTPARADCARLSQCAFWYFITSLDQHEDAVHINRLRVTLLDDLIPKFRLQLNTYNVNVHTFWESMIWKKKAKRQESDCRPRGQTRQHKPCDFSVSLPPLPPYFISYAIFKLKKKKKRETFAELLIIWRAVLHVLPSRPVLS